MTTSLPAMLCSLIPPVSCGNQMIAAVFIDVSLFKEKEKHKQSFQPAATSRRSKQERRKARNKVRALESTVGTEQISEQMCCEQRVCIVIGLLGSSYSKLQYV